MDKKTSFVLYPSDFLAAVHNFKKSQVADLIIALCEINFYGEVSCKLSDPVKKRFQAIQETIDKNNAKYQEICEKRQANGSKGGSKTKAKRKQTASKVTQKLSVSHPSESEYEYDYEYDKDSDKEKFINKFLVVNAVENVDNSGFGVTISQENGGAQ